MEERYEVRRRELLAGCEVKSELFDGIRDRLREFMEPFAECLWRAGYCAPAATGTSTT